MRVKIFKIYLVVCPDRHMRNLSRILDFISHLEVQEGKKEREREKEGGRRRGRRKGEGSTLSKNQFCLLVHWQQKFYNINRLEYEVVP